MVNANIDNVNEVYTWNHACVPPRATLQTSTYVSSPTTNLLHSIGQRFWVHVMQANAANTKSINEAYAYDRASVQTSLNKNLANFGLPAIFG